MTTTTTNTPEDCTAPDARFTDDLKAYLDGELTKPRRAAVRRHLDGCAACRTEVGEMERATNILRGAGAEDVRGAALAPGLRARLVDTMRTESADDAPTAAPERRPVPLWKARPLAVFGTAGTLVAAAGAAWFTLYTQAQGQQAEVTVVKLSAPESAPQAAVATGAMPAGAPVAENETRSYAGEVAKDIREIARPQMAARRAEAKPAAPPAPPLFDAAKQPSVTDGVAMSRQIAPAHPAGPALVNGRYESPRPTADAKGTLNGAMSGDNLASIEADAERQVHREASLGIAVAKLEPASDKVEEITAAAGGFVASNNLNTSEDGYKNADLTLRIPVKEFDPVMRRLSGLGEVVSKSVSGEDITEQLSDATQAEAVLAQEVADAAAKLKAERMSDRRTSQKEWELRQLKVQRAQNQARLALLRKMGRLSTISVNLSEKRPKPAPAPKQSALLGDLRETNRSAMLAFQSAVRVPVVLIIWVLAFSPIWAPLLLAYRYAARRSAAR